MSRSRKILLVLLGIAVLMATIHFTINGIPALSSLNPHGH
ncbi:hypothetical protein GCM10010151_02820 [Actinoallomurus spadix]|uniref:Uncharacterized protein n=1 Tax=Actinoallomurus spadix TaxID=79912 RepID=A0ABN0VSK1_9ACTN